jgi:hypothetical protein
LSLIEFQIEDNVYGSLKDSKIIIMKHLSESPHEVGIRRWNGLSLAQKRYYGKDRSLKECRREINNHHYTQWRNRLGYLVIVIQEEHYLNYGLKFTIS